MVRTWPAHSWEQARCAPRVCGAAQGGRPHVRVAANRLAPRVAGEVVTLVALVQVTQQAVPVAIVGVGIQQLAASEVPNLGQTRVGASAVKRSHVAMKRSQQACVRARRTGRHECHDGSCRGGSAPEAG